MKTEDAVSFLKHLCGEVKEAVKNDSPGNYLEKTGEWFGRFNNLINQVKPDESDMYEDSLKECFIVMSTYVFEKPLQGFPSTGFIYYILRFNLHQRFTS